VSLDAAAACPPDDAAAFCLVPYQHQIRDLYMTFRNFRNRITDFLRFRQVTARMDRFPDASQADLARCDGICIICREEMAAAGLNKKLHCGHVFHLHCLR
jgi:E3 ubiquitin-protein ligase synoviolin